MWMEILMAILAVITDICVFLICLAFTCEAYEKSKLMGFGVGGLSFGLWLLGNLAAIEMYINEVGIFGT